MSFTLGSPSGTADGEAVDNDNRMSQTCIQKFNELYKKEYKGIH